LNSTRFAWIAGLGCTALVLIMLMGLGGLLFFATGVGDAFQAERRVTLAAAEATSQEGDVVPTLTPALVQGTGETLGEGTSRGATAGSGR
jgi:hypothetical protein